MAQYETQGTFDGVGVPLYEQLTRMRNEDARLEPGLAVSWQISADAIANAGIDFQAFDPSQQRLRNAVDLRCDRFDRQPQ